MNVVFVGGIHGVGKSTLCERIASNNDFLHVKASRLIRDASPSWSPAHEKLVQDIPLNQRLLVTGFAEIRAACGARVILLDGHFTLGKHDGVFEAVSPAVFAALGVSSLICLRDAPSAIASRIRSRDGQAPNEAYLAAFQDAELEHAALVSSVLTLRLSVIDAAKQGVSDSLQGHL